MRRGSHVGAFTLIELLVSLALVALMVSLALPSLGRSLRHAKRVQCLNNQRQIGIAFQQFADLNHNRHPMQFAPSPDGWIHRSNSIAFFVLSERPFVETSRELASPKLVICAADRGRTPAEAFEALTVDQVSYVVATNTRPGNARSVVATDRNVHVVQTVELQEKTDRRILYGRDLHELRGNVLMGDGRVEWVGGFSWSPTVSVPRRGPEEGTNRTAVVPAVAVRSNERPGSKAPSPATGFGAPSAPATPGYARSLPEATPAVTNAVVQSPVDPVPVAGLLPPDEESGPRRTHWWWWLLVLILLVLGGGYLGRRRAGGDRLRDPVEFYTGAAIHAEAMLATLAEHGIPARGEYVHDELREEETEVNRPLRIVVERGQLDEANDLFASGAEV